MKIRDESPDCSFQHTAQQETEKLKPMQKGLYRCEKLPQLFKKFLFLSACFLCLLTVPNESQLPDRDLHATLVHKKPHYCPAVWEQHCLCSGTCFTAQELTCSPDKQFCPSPSPDHLALACLWECLHLCFMPQFHSPCAPIRQKRLIKWRC